MSSMPEAFGEPTRAWFEAAFAEPTSAQALAWKAIGAGQHALVVAPTGSGKTLAAFLWSLDRLFHEPRPPQERACRVLYVSPLKALAVDVERNLRAPLAGIRTTAERLGRPELPTIRVGVRSGDTTPAERRRLTTKPPDIMITTPESLYLMLTSAARESLRGVETVIVDEVHAVAGSKRGAHLALSLERLDALLERPAQRIGLSATVRPVEEVARFLGGSTPVEVVAPGADKRWDLSVVVPVPDMGDLDLPPAYDGPDTPDPADADPRRTSSIWPHVEERVLDLVRAHGSTIVFANSRRLAERLTGRLNELAEETVARAHHGSVSKEQRAIIEDDLKRGRLPCVVATSSLELGIDMGAVDLVVQIESPPSVSSALQRIGRSGHQVGETSRGVLFPKHRGDLVPTAVAVERMRHGQIEQLRVPGNPLDVLAQQVVAMTAMEPWKVEDLYALVRRSAPYAGLARSAFEATLDLLAGRYPSDEFAELRPRIVWDRVTGELTARPGSHRLAVTSGGTIPDRGLFRVQLVGAQGPGRRVGELDEEMVYESRVGDVFTLGSSTWRIEDITNDQVLVSPAPGAPGRMPFWHGDSLGRPAELGAAVGAFTREVAAMSPPEATARAVAAGLDEWAADNLTGLIAEQRESTGVVPHDRQLLVERFRDELGDWRLVVHSPYGAPVHQPWALAINARLRERYADAGPSAQALASDDGIVIRLPDTDQDPPGADLVVFDPDELEQLVTDEVGGSALFAARFREAAARALLLPRRTPGRRAPLWQQRQRSAQLLAVAARYPGFPIVLETVREVLQDVYDVPALVALQRRIGSREVAVSEVTTQRPSPFAHSLLFGYVAAFLYEGDSPLAERKAAALTLDQSLLAELLGRTELRELLDPEVLAEVEAELQRLSPDRHARDAEGVADLLRLLGPLSESEVQRRTDASAADALATLEKARRVVAVRMAGEQRWAAVEDVARLRDGLGVPAPPGTAAVFLEPVADPLGDLVGRFARTHGPFTEAEAAAALGLGVAVVRQTLVRLAADGRVLQGEFRPGGAGQEWCEAEVLRRLRRRSLARLRHEVEPVEPAYLGRFLPAWQHLTTGRDGGPGLRGIDGVRTVVDQLDGAPVPASALESLVLPARVRDYTPSMLDELTATGEVVWAGRGSLPGDDGWVSLHPADTLELTLPPAGELELEETHRAILEALAGGGAFFFRQLAGATPQADVARALWELVWSGRVSGDTVTPLRDLLRAGSATHRVRRTPPRVRSAGRRSLRAPAGTRLTHPGTAGRWFALPDPEGDPTRRAHAAAESLLERHGVVTRGAVAAEGTPGGFAATYRVLSAFEESGRCRRGYFVEGLGAAQFGTPGAVDRLRALVPPKEPRALTMAATDPANPYGAALPWPALDHGHRPGRKAGAMVVLVGGELVLYVERGGKSLLRFGREELLDVAVGSLVGALLRGGVPLRIERVDGESVLAPEAADLRALLERHGFVTTHRGMRWRVTAGAGHSPSG